MVFVRDVQTFFLGEPEMILDKLKEPNFKLKSQAR